MRLAWVLLALATLTGTLWASQEAVAQNRLFDEPPAAGENGTAGQGGYASRVTVCVTDNFLYGFCEPDPDRVRRLGNVFTVYLAPVNGSVVYRVILDDIPLELGNGETEREISGPFEEPFRMPVIRRAELRVELVRGNETEVQDFGLLRMLEIEEVKRGVEEEGIVDSVGRKIREFRSSDWTWFHIKLTIVGVATPILMLYAAWQKGRDEERYEEPMIYAN